MSRIWRAVRVLILLMSAVGPRMPPPPPPMPDPTEQVTDDGQVTNARKPSRRR
jgi:hypothetical protein